MLEQRFLAFINENNLIGPGGRVLLAVSGGLDSVAMTWLFARTGLPFAVAHVDFGLRGAESDADAAFVQNIADQCGVPFHLTRFDTARVAAERGCSIQMAARELRYDWFAQLRRDYGYVSVATAHHQNDVLETVLLNLTRGTGLAGLRGIAVRQAGVIRPLLFATRDELADYVHEHGLTYREDSSNADDKYARNRIRHHVVPVLLGLNPNLLRETLLRTTESLRAAEALLQDELSTSWNRVVEAQNGQLLLPAHKLLQESEPGFRLAEWLRPFGFRPDQTRQMLASLQRPAGQVFESGTHRVTHETAGLLLTERSALPTYTNVVTNWPDAPVDLPDGRTLIFDLFDNPGNVAFSTDAAVVCVDADRLVFPLTIRIWQPGDRFRPLGMAGSKLVSNLLNDLKLTRPERERVAVLLSGDQIVWVIGRRLAHPFRLTSQTRRVLRITVAERD